MSAELPGVKLELEEMDEAPTIMEDPTPSFKDLTAHVLDNAGINHEDMLQAAHNRAEHEHVTNLGPAIIDANEDKILYEITFNLPDTGLHGDNAVPPDDMVEADPNALAVVAAPPNPMEIKPRRHSTQSGRSALGHQPYDDHAPRITFMQQEENSNRHMTFLRMGEVCAHRSVVKGANYVKMTKAEQMHFATFNWTDMAIDHANHKIDPDLMTTSKDELKVWGYIMMQYNLKPGLCKFGVRGEAAAITKMTQLHIMDMWMAMDPSKLSREDRMKALSLLLFLKAKQAGKIKGRACINGVPQRAYI